MKAFISKDSVYPMYALAPHANGVEVPDDLYQRYSTNIAEFDAIQAQIAKIYNDIGSASEPRSSS